MKNYKIILLLAICACLNGMETTNKYTVIAQQIEENPVIVLKTNNALATSVYAHYLKDIKNKKTPKSKGDFLASIIQTAQNNDPIFLIDECGAQGNSVCILDRDKNGTAKTVYENKVANTIVQAAQAKNNQVIWTVFAAGNLFPELRILKKVIDQKKEIQFTINCIDTAYKYYNSLIKDMQINDITISYDKESLEGAAKEFFEGAPKSELFPTHPVFIYARFSQLVQFVKGLAPSCTMILNVYADKNAYLKSSYSKVSTTDVISACDIAEGIADYTALVQSVKEKNNNVQAILLNKKKSDEGAESIYIETLESGKNTTEEIK